MFVRRYTCYPQSVKGGLAHIQLEHNYVHDMLLCIYYGGKTGQIRIILGKSESCKSESCRYTLKLSFNCLFALSRLYHTKLGLLRSQEDFDNIQAH